MRKKILLLSITIFTIIFLSIVIAKRKNEKSTESDFITVSTSKTKFQKLSVPIETFGSVIYKTKNEITNIVEGTVIKKNVKEGDYVKKGQVLYELKNLELEIQHSQYQNQLNSAEANLDLSKAKLKEEEQLVKAKLIEIENKNRKIDQIVLNLNRLKEKLETNTQLNKLGGITDQSIKDMNDEITILESDLLIEKKELEKISLGFTTKDLENEGIIPSPDNNELILQIINLNTKIPQADLKVAAAEVENNKKNILLIEKLLDDLIIRSPLNGIIGQMNFEEGEYIEQNKAVALIMDVSTCYASMNIQENNIYNISLGSKTSITIPSINKTFNSTISDISPIADNTTGMFNIKASFPNLDNIAKPGMFIKCSIENNDKRDFIIIPESALININKENAECFLVKKNIALKQSVIIETIKNGQVYIKTGLSADQIIINNPTSNIKEGTYVKTL